MQKSLVSRVEALENQGGNADGLVIIRAFVSPGPNGPIHHEPLAMRGDAGWTLDRHPGEGCEAFRSRAVALAPRNAWGFACLQEVTQ